MESAKKNSKSKSSSAKPARTVTSPDAYFVVCVNSGGYVDLEPLKVYRVKHDASANAQGLLRVVDFSGEDYLYPAEFFRPIQATKRLFKIVAELA